MPQFPAVLSLAELNGQDGFEIRGLGQGDILGFSVSLAGDVNGDGFDDMILASQRHAPGSAVPHSDYVVFGKAGGFGAEFDLSALNGRNGFRVDGLRNTSRTYSLVASAGDVNGDNFDDIILGSPYTPIPVAGYTGPDSRAGAAYVVFGKAGGFGATFDVASLNGSNGFRLDGVYQVDRAGTSVSSAGDINGDGFDDLIVGAPYGRHTTDGRSTYVIFGKAGGFAASTSLKTVDGTNGFRIISTSEDYAPGVSVSSAGDVNGDGFDDIIVGNKRAPGSATSDSSAYVVFGKASGFAGTLDLAALKASEGFRLIGVQVGMNTPSIDVSSAGDINADGFDDMIVGSGEANEQDGVSYVVFGKAGGFGASVNVSTLNGANGFRLTSGLAGGQVGLSVSSAGDVNGDGFDDLLISAPNEYRSDASTGYSAGATYVVFGKAGRFSAGFDLSTLNGDNGFRIAGGPESYKAGVSVSGAGDINGDGFDDILIGAKEAETGGVTRQGASYVVFGHAPDVAVTRTGTAIANTIMGGAFNDRLDGAAGADTLKGLGGSDVYYVDNAGDRVIEAPGGGVDTVMASVNYTLAADQEIERLYTTNDAGTSALRLTGNEFGQSLIGNAGANRIDGRGGADAMKGGLGDDTYVIDNVGDRITELRGEGVDTVLSSVNFGFGAGVYAENLTLTGSAGVKGTGNTSANVIIGNSGANTLDGSSGRDTLTGGLGNDRFLFSTALDASKNVDRVADFSNAAGNNDTFQLDDAIFTALKTGPLAAAAFMANTTGVATQADDRLIYNTATGELFYDADGLNGVAGIRFAIQVNHAALTASDFSII